MGCDEKKPFFTTAFVPVIYGCYLGKWMGRLRSTSRLLTCTRVSCSGRVL